MYYSVDKIQPTAGDNSATTKTVRDGKYNFAFNDIQKYPKQHSVVFATIDQHICVMIFAPKMCVCVPEHNIQLILVLCDLLSS